MSFSTVYDAIRARIPTLTGFGSKTEIPNPYDLEDNHEAMLRDGWGLTASDSAVISVEFNETCDVQSIGVVLAREVLKTDSDPDALITAVKSLKADATTLRVNFIGTGFDDSSLIDIRYDSTSGVETLASDKSQILTLTVNFSALIREAL